MRRALCVLPLLVASVAIAADDIPGWVRAAAAQKLPQFGAKVPAAVVLHEADVVVEESGRIVTTERYAVRILNRPGMNYAHAVKSYMRDTGKVRDLRGWTVSAAGDAKKLPKEAYLDVSLGGDALYEEGRGRVVNAASQCDPNALFAYESVVEDRSIFTQFEWAAQSALPVQVARFSLTTPPAWESKGMVINRPEMQGTKSGTTVAFEFHDLPFLDDEEASPELASLAPRVAVSLFPPGGMSPNHGPSFAKWDDVARWSAMLSDPQAVPDGEIAAKVQALTREAATPEGRIRAIAKWVQGIRYVSIQTGLGRGGGYKPHAAAAIFARSYGDCKDKATLLRAMLKSAGVESWPVLIYSGDPLYVRSEWPTPQQFNHEILAIRASEGMVTESTVETGKGRVLIFDPTDEDTPFGEIPVHEQNSFAVLVAAENGGLFRVPAVTADGNRVERSITAKLHADGSIEGALHEKYAGWPNSMARYSRRQTNEQDYVKRLEARITRGIRAAQVTDPKAADSGDGFGVDLSFRSPSYAQMMQSRLMVFRPSILRPSMPVPGGRAKRQHPAVLNAGTWTESARVELPKEFGLDEKPERVRIDSPFGTYESECQVDGDVLTFTRKLTLNSMVVSAADFAKLNEFGERVAGADDAQVVLAKK